jgi:tetratricopeptide (TPR) repeat protein
MMLAMRLFPMHLATVIVMGLLVAGDCTDLLRGFVTIVEERLTTYALARARVADYAEAIAALTTAAMLAPHNSELYILRGQMYLNLYEWDKSLEDYNTAIDLAPEYAEAYFYRGVLYYSVLQTGQSLHEDALADFRHYLELAPEGEHAGQARDYVDKIEAELAALNP